MMSDAVDVDLSHKKDAEKVLINILCKVESYLLTLSQSQNGNMIITMIWDFCSSFI